MCAWTDMRWKELTYTYVKPFVPCDLRVLCVYVFYGTVFNVYVYLMLRYLIHVTKSLLREQVYLN